MTENEWLYLKTTQALDVSYEDLMKFEDRELAWRFAHIKSGMTLSRLEWEMQQAAIVKAKLEKKRKRREAIKLWVIFFLLLTTPVLFIYYLPELSKAYEFLFVGNGGR